MYFIYLFCFTFQSDGEVAVAIFSQGIKPRARSNLHAGHVQQQVRGLDDMGAFWTIDLREQEAVLLDIAAVGRVLFHQPGESSPHLVRCES